MKQFAVATNEIGDVITSSPGEPRDVSEEMETSRAARHRGRIRRADALGKQLLEALDRGAEREPPGA